MRTHLFFKHNFFVLFFVFLFSVFLFPSSVFAGNIACVRNYTKGATPQCIETSAGSCREQCDVVKSDNSGLICYQDDTVPTCSDWEAREAQKKASASKVQADLKAQADAKKADHDRIAAENIANGPVCRCKLNDADALPEVIEGIQSAEGCARLSDPTTPQHTYAECVFERRGEPEAQAQREDAQIKEASQAANTKEITDSKSNPLKQFAGEDGLGGLNKIKGGTSLQGLIGLIIKTAMGVMGTLALAMIIYGGLLWMTALGNASQVDKAINVIFWAALGIFVIFGSYAIVNFIFDATNPILQTK